MSDLISRKWMIDHCFFETDKLLAMNAPNVRADEILAWITTMADAGLDIMDMIEIMCEQLSKPSTWKDGRGEILYHDACVLMAAVHMTGKSKLKF